MNTPADTLTDPTHGVTRLSVSRRRTALRRLAETLKRHADRLACAVGNDLGKPEREFLDDELHPLRSDLCDLIRQLPRLARRQRRLFFWRERLLPVPRGRVLVCGHWAEPIRSALEPLAAALAAGNRVVLRPAPQTPAAARLLAELVGEVFTEQEVRVAERGSTVQELADGAFDLAVCTGTPAEAAELLRAGPRMMPLLLNQTGKNPAVVLTSAGIRRAARRIVRAKFRNAGQSPDAPDYVLAYSRIRQKLVYEMSREVRALFGTDPELDKKPFRVLNGERFGALRKLLDRGRLACGGEVDRAKLYIAPTILDGITIDDPIMQETIAGPILPVLEIQTRSEAAEIINRLPPAPLCSCFSNGRVAQRLLAAVRCGGAVVNDCVSRARYHYCGPGENGRGVYTARDAFLAFSFLKPIGGHSRFLPGVELAVWLKRFFGRARG